MYRLIINADDLGLSPGVNRAIKQAYTAGGISSASIIVNTPYSRAAAEEIALGLGLHVGLHLNLTHGRCVADPRRMPLLVDEEGFFQRNASALFQALLFKHREREELLDQIAVELEAQMDMAEKLELRPTHFDSHQHVHMIPAIHKQLKKLAPRHGYTRCRNTCEPFFCKRPVSQLGRACTNRNILKWLVIQHCRRHRDSYFTMPDLYFGLLSSSCARECDVRCFLRNARPGETLELGVHLGTGDSPEDTAYYKGVLDRFLNSGERLHELQLVTGGAILHELSRSGGRLISFKDLEPQKTSRGDKE
ncbi:MAG: carbohydrate deacetylase [Desulfovibrionaceae bacterium]